MRATFLLVGGGEAGHVLPMLSLVHGLSSRGHRVLMITSSKFEEGVRVAGGEVVSPKYYRDPMERMKERMSKGRPSALQMFGRLRMARKGFLELVSSLVRELDEVIPREGVDCVVAGIIGVGARYSTERAGLPFATFSPNPLAAFAEEGGMMLPPARWLTRVPRWLGHPLLDRLVPLRKHRRVLGMPPREGGAAELLHLLVSDELHLVTVPPWFYPGLKRLKAGHLCVGPMSFDLPQKGAPFPVESLKPGTVLVSTTTVPRDHGLFQRVLEAVAPMQAPVLATAAAADKIPTGLGPHIRIESFAPHGEVLPHVSALVTHGGWGAVGRALRHGVPMLIIPIFGDQPVNGRRLAELGLAYHLPLKKASPEAIRDALSRLLADEELKARAKAVAEELKGLDSPRLAAEALESLVARRRAKR